MLDSLINRCILFCGLRVPAMARPSLDGTSQATSFHIRASQEKSWGAFLRLWEQWISLTENTWVHMALLSRAVRFWAAPYQKNMMGEVGAVSRDPVGE